MATRQERDFTCIIDDRILHERFTAKVTVSRRNHARKSLQPGKIDRADIYITPVSGQTAAAKVHSHFVLYDFMGRGLYIVRDQKNNDEHRLPCTIWDLGHSFGNQVMQALEDLACATFCCTCWSSRPAC
jgi:hypothetical protein